MHRLTIALSCLLAANLAFADRYQDLANLPLEKQSPDCGDQPESAGGSDLSARHADLSVGHAPIEYRRHARRR